MEQLVAPRGHVALATCLHKKVTTTLSGRYAQTLSLRLHPKPYTKPNALRVLRSHISGDLRPAASTDQSRLLN